MAYILHDAESIAVLVDDLLEGFRDGQVYAFAPLPGGTPYRPRPVRVVEEPSARGALERLYRPGAMKSVHHSVCAEKCLMPGLPFVDIRRFAGMLGLPVDPDPAKDISVAVSYEEGPRITVTLTLEKPTVTGAKPAPTLDDDLSSFARGLLERGPFNVSRSMETPATLTQIVGSPAFAEVLAQIGMGDALTVRRTDGGHVIMA